MIRLCELKTMKVDMSVKATDVRTRLTGPAGAWHMQTSFDCEDVRGLLQGTVESRLGYLHRLAALHSLARKPAFSKMRPRKFRLVRPHPISGPGHVIRWEQPGYKPAFASHDPRHEAPATLGHVPRHGDAR